jgi:hypothetical protein
MFVEICALIVKTEVKRTGVIERVKNKRNAVNSKVATVE